jgi:hypothetical protein
MTRFHHPLSVVLILVPTLIVGCGGGEAGMVVKKPAGERPDLDGTITSKGTLAIPSGQPFNYANYASGQLGTARGESKAIGKDGARCGAQAGNGGSAWGEFQLGYCFDNASGGPLDASIKLTYRLAEARSLKGALSDARGVESSGKIALHFIIKDSNGQTLKSEELAMSSLVTGPISQTNSREIVFDARFEPDRGYYLVLSCRTDTQAADGADTDVSVEVQGVALEIAWRRGETKTAAEVHEPDMP